MRVLWTFALRLIMYFSVLVEGGLVFGFDPFTPLRLAGFVLLAFMWAAMLGVFEDKARQITGLHRDTLALTTGVVSGVCVVNSAVFLILFKSAAVLDVILVTVVCSGSLGVLILFIMKGLLGKIENEERQLRDVNQRLEQTLEDIDELSGILPICAWCRKMRSDSGYWMQIEKYLETHAKAQVMSSLCHECERKSHQEA